MKQMKENMANNKTMELATFYIENVVCGIDILKIQEINKFFELTPVPQAPEYVKGVLNLRGRIVTIIDLGQKLGFSETETSDTSRNIIVNSKGEHIGLLVAQIRDVIQVDWEKVETPPVNISGVQESFFKGVFKADDYLIGILDVDEVLKESE
jgi:purine-binding chemotaxis protein CheW